MEIAVLIDHFRSPQGRLTTNQSIALADEFGKIARNLVDQNGQKIFQYNNRTHNIELADERGLNDESKTKKALVEVMKNINGDQGYVITAERRTKKAEINCPNGAINTSRKIFAD